MKKSLAIALFLPLLAFAETSQFDTDKELDSIYQKTIKRAGSVEQKNKLMANQQAWLKYARSYCTLTDGHPMQDQLTDCMRQMGEARIKDLNDTLCEDGDASSFCF